MKKDCSKFTKQMSAVMALTFGFCGAGFAQGMAEYAGVVGMPKPMPSSGNVSKTLNALYGTPGKALSGVSGSSGSSPNPGATRSYASTKAPRAAVTKAALPKTKNGMVISGDLPGGQAEAQRAAVLEVTKAAEAAYKAGVDAKNKGKLAEAETQLRKSLVMREQYWANQDKRIPEIQVTLGEINNTLHQDKKAIADLEGALASYSKFYGPGSDHRLKPLLLLSDSQSKVGEKVKSYESYSQAYRLATRAKLDAFNPTELRLTTVKMALGVDRFREAVDMCEIATSPPERAKLNQEQLLSVMDDYALALKGMNRTRDANEILAEAEKIRGSAAPVSTPASTPEKTSGTPAN